MITFENGIDIRCRADRTQVAKIKMVSGGYRYCVIGTQYGHIHTTAGDIRTWATYSGARRAMIAYINIWGN